LLERLDFPEPWRGKFVAAAAMIEQLDQEVDAIEKQLRQLGADHRLPHPCAQRPTNSGVWRFYDSPVRREVTLVALIVGCVVAVLGAVLFEWLGSGNAPLGNSVGGPLSSLEGAVIGFLLGFVLTRLLLGGASGGGTTADDEDLSGRG